MYSCDNMMLRNNMTIQNKIVLFGAMFIAVVLIESAYIGLI